MIIVIIKCCRTSCNVLSSIYLLLSFSLYRLSYIGLISQWTKFGHKNEAEIRSSQVDTTD